MPPASPVRVELRLATRDPHGVGDGVPPPRLPVGRPKHERLAHARLAAPVRLQLRDERRGHGHGLFAGRGLRARHFAHNDIVVAAPAGEIWEHLIHAAAWPNWYSNASAVTVNDPSRLLAPGVTFDWVTFGAHIHSTVNEFEPTARIGWYGETDQWLAYHTWLLEPRGERTTYVVMEETGTGANPKKLADSNPGHMHRGHDLWNVSLTFLCETTQS